MFLRILPWLLILGLAWYLWKRFAARPAPPEPLPGKGGARDAAALPMLRCEHCGLHVPAPEAVRQGGHVYCCEEHRLAAGK